jgi:putative drug exporter of the RND superfamily
MSTSRRLPGSRVLAALVVLGWIAVAGLAGPLAGKLAGTQRNDPALFLPSDAEATRVLRLQADFQGTDQTPAVIVYQRSSGITAADRALVDRQVAAAARLPGVAGAPSPVLASPDGKALEAVVPVRADTLAATGDAVAELRRVVRGDAGLAAHVTGPAGLGADFGSAFKALDFKLLAGTTVVVVLILLAVYRSPLLWLVPLAGVGGALVLAQALVYLAATHLGLQSNGQSQGILTVLLFGAGTDYALLMISRYREELQHRPRVVDAMLAAWRGAAPAVVASGSTVILGLLCLTLSSNGANRSLGPTGAIGIAAAMLAMLTLLPALLTLTGRRIFWPRTPRLRAGAGAPGAWGRIAALVGRRSRPALVLSGLVLAGLSIGLTQLRAEGLPAADQYTVSVDSVAGQKIADAHFAVGQGTPAVIVARAGALQRVLDRAARVPGVSSVAPVVDAAAPGKPVKVAGGRVLVEATLLGRADGPAATATVERLRTALHGEPGADALVGGPTAISIDTAAASGRDFRLIVPIVLAVITAVLVVLLRSLLAPLLLVGTVVLSFAASLGLSALVFSRLFHFAGEDSSFPLTAFVFLVALGVDYNIFLMSRVREAALRGGTRTGTLEGLRSTGVVITSAGIVLAATFAVFAVLPLVIFAEIGFTVAAGVLIDTLLVRTLLVPALAYQLGGRIWWPARLAADRPEPPSAEHAAAPAA